MQLPKLTKGEGPWLMAAGTAGGLLGPGDRAAARASLRRWEYRAVDYVLDEIDKGGVAGFTARFEETLLLLIDHLGLRCARWKDMHVRARREPRPAYLSAERLLANTTFMTFFNSTFPFAVDYYHERLRIFDARVQAQGEAFQARLRLLRHSRGPAGAVPSLVGDGCKR